MAKAEVWTRDQLLLALRLYVRTPFGRLHGKNPEIVHLAQRIGRTPNALAMKAVNFAGIDPKLDRKGLKNASQADRTIWAEFEGDATRLAIEAEEAYSRLQIHEEPTDDSKFRFENQPTESVAMTKVRLVQSFFREAILVTYESRCAISGLSTPGLLVASHIIPWAKSVPLRADPRNGICLNALFDRAFDRGFITIDESWKVVVAKSLRDDASQANYACSLLDVEGQRITVPNRFPPKAESLSYHREHVFEKY